MANAIPVTADPKETPKKTPKADPKAEAPKVVEGNPYKSKDGAVMPGTVKLVRYDF